MREGLREKSNMVTDISLPAEILTAILEKVDVQDLWHVRMASRTLCAAVNPIVFRVVSVISATGKVQNLAGLIDIPDIAVHIREVFYFGTNDHWDLSHCASSSPHSINLIMTFLCVRWWVTSPLSVGTMRHSDPKLESSFSKFLSRIHQLPRLETINFWFSPMYHVSLSSDSGRCPPLQASFLAALTASFSVCAPSNLTTLSLQCLLVSGFPPESAPFLTHLTPALRRLYLSVHNKIPLDDVRWCNFWTTFFPHIILAPVQRSLTDLKLGSNMAIGSSSGLSFAGLYFPHLFALSLSNFFWEPSVGIELFILRHANTLARLHLYPCSLPEARLRLLSPSPSTALAEAEELSNRWEQIWDRFAAEITALVEFCTYNSSYAIYDSDGYVRWTDVSESRKAADIAALQRFQTTVAARLKEMCTKS